MFESKFKEGQFVKTREDFSFNVFHNYATIKKGARGFISAVVDYGSYYHMCIHVTDFFDVTIRVTEKDLEAA